MMPNTIMSLGKCILDFSLMFWLSAQFFNRKWENRRWVPGAVIIVSSVILYFINSLCIPQLNTLAGLVLSPAMIFILFNGHIWERLLCSAAEVLLELVCEFIPISVYSLIDQTSMASLTNETIRNAGFNLIGTCLFAIIVLSICHFVALRGEKENRDITITGNPAVMTVPLVSIGMIYYILFHASDAGTDQRAALQSIFILIGILLMNLVVILGEQNQRKHYQLQRELDRVSRLEQLNQTVIEQQDQYIQEMKGLAHDYTKQLEGIKALIRTEHGGASIAHEVQTYTEDMLQHISESCRFAFIPSPALRTILSQTQLRCNASHITFNTDIQYADFSFISFPDIYTLFENPLENAVTACKEISGQEALRSIHLSIVRKKNLVWVEIKNTKANRIILRNNEIQTTKEDSSRHGLGLKNMRRVVSRYGGYFNTEYTADEFTVTMALPVTEP